MPLRRLTCGGRPVLSAHSIQRIRSSLFFAHENCENRNDSFESIARNLPVAVVAARLFRNDSPPASNVDTASEPAENADQSAAVPKDLADLLKARGYVEIPLTLTKDPYFEVEVKIKGQALVFVLDTGTNHTFIDKAAAGRLGLAAIRRTENVRGYRN